MIALTTLLVLIEPDLGTTVLMFSLGIVLMYAAGVRFTNITALLFALALLALPWLSIYLERHPYIFNRLTSFLSRGDDAQNVVVKGLDQIGMAHRDLSFGGIWGQGPEAPRYPYFADHTDLAIASVGFSTGLLGVTMVIFAYWLVVSTALQVGQLAARVRPMTPNLHGASIMATGAMYMIVGQAFVNLAVAAGIFPVTGRAAAAGQLRIFQHAEHLDCPGSHSLGPQGSQECPARRGTDAGADRGGLSKEQERGRRNRNQGLERVAGRGRPFLQPVVAGFLPGAGPPEWPSLLAAAC